MAARARLFEAIEAREDELIDLIARLVQQPSVLGNEAGAQAVIAEYLRAGGQEPDIWEIPDSLLERPGAGNSGVPFAGRPNVAATLAGVGGGGKSLILNGHVDVVSPEPLANWHYDPWAAQIAGRRMYGRGAYDMKAGLAINMYLARLVRELGIPLKADLTVQSVIEEECTGNGALSACYRDDTRYHADAVIITEPSNGTYTAAHVGVLWFRVEVLGQAVHAAVAWKGVNAIYRMLPVIEELRALDAEMNQESHPLFEGIEHPINLNIGVIQGGDWPSSVAGACAIDCRLSMYPGRTVEETRARVLAAVERATERDGWLVEHPPTVTWYGFQSAGSEIAPEEPLVRALALHHERERGTPLRPRSGTGTNDMRNFMVYSDMPALCYGVSGFGAHEADEWLDLDSLVPTTKVLGAFLLDWCGVAAQG
ncbi:MAG: acetylornithine deacetylase [Chloroflexi bacterium]|nr:MAG: acetylornithine deacetylase [Chloroflexota bacterium]